MQKSIFMLLLAASTAFLFSCKTDTKTETANTTTETTTTEVATTTTEATTVALDNANYVVDAANSSLSWLGSKASGDKHTGTVKLSSGSFVVTEGNIMAGQAVIDMSSIVVGDLEGKWKQKLEGHLKSEDFFDVPNHPTATINIKSDGATGYTGELTMRGVTKPVKLPATIAKEGNNLVVTLPAFNIDRTEWGVKYNSGKFFQNLKDKLISDEMQISGKVVLAPKG